jgi:hypothetical protein
MLPAFIVLGASGSGKSTILRDLSKLDAGERPDAVYLDSDILLTLLQHGQQAYRDWWLWVCFNISQSGRPMVLFGNASPREFEQSSRRKLFTTIHYLAVTCATGELRARLEARPAWRGASGPDFVRDHVAWNERLRPGEQTTRPAPAILATTGRRVRESTLRLVAWLRDRLAACHGGSNTE